MYFKDTINNTYDKNFGNFTFSKMRLIDSLILCRSVLTNIFNADKVKFIHQGESLITNGHELRYEINMPYLTDGWGEYINFEKLYQHLISGNRNGLSSSKYINIDDVNYIATSQTGMNIYTSSGHNVNIKYLGDGQFNIIKILDTSSHYICDTINDIVLFISDYKNGII